MTGDQDRFAQMVFQALSDRWMCVGEFAWLLLGVLLLACTLASLLVLRWVVRGGLSRYPTWW